MASLYKIIFAKAGAAETDPGISVAPNSSASISIGSNDYTLSLVSLDIDKGLYRAQKVSAVMQISAQSGKNLPAVKDVYDYFSKLPCLNVCAVDDGTAYDVGKYYFIHGITPMLIGGQTSSMKILLDIYSPDKLFDEERFCRTYTGKKLAKEILTNAVTEFGLKNINKNIGVTTHLNNLSYVVSVTKNELSSFEIRELIHPYLVQYNETFYEFLARCANRCGEFLFYEDGTMQIGLGSTAKPKKISSYKSISFAYHTPAGTLKAANSYSRNPAKAASSAAGHTFHNEAAYDEYLASFNKGGYDSMSGQYSTMSHPLSRVFANLLASTTLTEFLAKTGWEEATLAILVKSWADKANKGIDDDFFAGGDLNTITTKSGLKPEQYSTDLKTVSQFSTNPSSIAPALTKDIDNALLGAIRKAQINVASTGIEIDLGTRVKNILIGDILEITGVADKYIVTEISGSENVIGSSWQTTMKIKGVKWFEDAVPCPPAIVADYIRKTDAQTATVSKNADPLRLGRVRLKFPWDSDTDSVSPWVRVASPKATKGEGFYLKPVVGDEAIVDFIGGNIEKPVVTGFLYSTDKGLPYGGRTYDNVISTPGGQTIRMRDVSGISAFLSGIFPAVGMLRTFIPSAFSNDKAKNDVSGDIEITDRQGLYSVSMSSTKRSVSVSSPFGNVSLNAYTGININAPNGDIKIVGKNVDIVAGNNLNLVSGKNIKDKGFINFLTSSPSGTDAGQAALAGAYALFVQNFLGKLLDIRLLRTVIETFLRPIEGTLSIKSFRYVKLAAGSGEAEIPLAAYKKNTTAKKRITESRNTESQMEATHKLTGAIEAIPEYVAGVISTYVNCYRELSKRKPTLEMALGAYCPGCQKVTAEKVIKDGFEAKNNTKMPKYLDTLIKEMKDQGLRITTTGKSILNSQFSHLFKMAKTFHPKEIHKKNSCRSKDLPAIYDKWVIGSNDSNITRFIKEVKTWDDFESVFLATTDNGTGLASLLTRTLIIGCLVDWGKDCGFKLPPTPNAVSDKEFKKFIDDIEIDTGLTTIQAIGKRLFDDIVQKPFLDSISKPFYDAVAWDDEYNESRILVSDNQPKTGNINVENAKYNLTGVNEAGLKKLKSGLKKQGYIPVTLPFEVVQEEDVVDENENIPENNIIQYDIHRIFLDEVGPDFGGGNKKEEDDDNYELILDGLE